MDTFDISAEARGRGSPKPSLVSGMVVDAPADFPPMRKWRGAMRFVVIVGGAVATWAAVAAVAVVATHRSR